MQFLIIPDIHCRKFWRDLDYDKYDKVIFLGDYLDPYSGEPNLEENSIEMLNDIISLKKSNPDKYILLTGNHTDHYIWSNMAEASRKSWAFREVYNEIFIKNLDLFQITYIYNNTIFSHAGITPEWAYRFLADYMKYDESALEENLVLETAKILMDTPLKDFNKHYIKALSNISSTYRGGFDDYGSCEWADIYEHIDLANSTIDNIVPKHKSDGYYQIFGHSQLKENPIVTTSWACVDCRRPFIYDFNKLIEYGSDNSL